MQTHARAGRKVRELDFVTILPHRFQSPAARMSSHLSLRTLVRAVAVLVVAALWSAQALAAAGAAIVESSLPNGLRILVKSDRRAPVVVVMVWYKAGSIDEVNGTT